MDKSWIRKDRLSLEYEFGVEKFLLYAEENASNPKEIPCPCARCGNFKKFSVKIIRGHLYENGFCFGYVNWIWHGEKCSRSTSSTSTQWRQSKATLTTKHVKPYVGQKKNLMKPPKQHAFMGKGVWKRFFAKRTAEKWLIKSGKFEFGEVHDRAIVRKKARTARDQKIVVELAKINAKLDILLEKKRKGELQSSESEDVLSTAMGTPEQSCRIGGTGGLVTPKLLFNFTKEKRTRITKSELLASDRWWAEELERRKQDLMSEIADLKKTIFASNLPSPMLSDEASC